MRLEASEAGHAFTVHDDGPGIPKAEREAVFEPLHRVRGTPNSTGLGLTTVRIELP